MRAVTPADISLTSDSMMRKIVAEITAFLSSTWNGPGQHGYRVPTNAETVKTRGLRITLEVESPGSPNNSIFSREETPFDASEQSEINNQKKGNKQNKQNETKQGKEKTEEKQTKLSLSSLCDYEM